MILVWPLLFNVGLILLSFSAWCHEGFGRLHHEQQDSSAHGTPVVVKMEWSMKKPPQNASCVYPAPYPIMAQVFRATFNKVSTGQKGK